MDGNGRWLTAPPFSIDGRARRLYHSPMPQTITLNEYESCFLPADALSQTEGLRLWQQFDQRGQRLQLTFPSPATGQRWKLTAQGWVGHIPLSPDLQIHISPRLPLLKLYQMWQTAYGLEAVDLLPGFTAVTSLPAFYEQIVRLLLLKVQRRQQQGLYRAYQQQTAVTPFVRGRIQPRPSAYSPTAQLLCHYQEHTADVAENQMVAYTLDQVARGRRCTPPLQTAVRRLAKQLTAVASPQPIPASQWATRPYSRLNQDYRLIHALCRFLLEHQGPTLQPGTAVMQPFLIHMPRLYELFVAEWLGLHLPAPWQLKRQEQVQLGRHNELRFKIDLVLYDAEGRATAVLDTKYKLPDRASTADVSQIVTYAQAKGCRQAWLIYPTAVPRPLDVQMQQLQLRSLTFAVDTDLDQAGQHCLSQLLTNHHPS